MPERLDRACLSMTGCGRGSQQIPRLDRAIFRRDFDGDDADNGQGNLIRGYLCCACYIDMFCSFF
ncbi:MAG: hypothetical protein R3E79_01955 [Caldilineaceae bacterium]